MPRFAHKECYRWLRRNSLAQVWLVTRNHLLNKTRVKRSVYNCKNANWSGLKELLLQTPRPWDMVFVPNDVDESFCKWCDLFISAVDDQIDEANLLNHCFHAVFSPPDLHPSTELTTQLRPQKRVWNRWHTWPTPSYIEPWTCQMPIASSKMI